MINPCQPSPGEIAFLNRPEVFEKVDQLLEQCKRTKKCFRAEDIQPPSFSPITEGLDIPEYLYERRVQEGVVEERVVEDEVVKEKVLVEKVLVEEEMVKEGVVMEEGLVQERRDEKTLINTPNPGKPETENEFDSSMDLEKEIEMLNVLSTPKGFIYESGSADPITWEKSSIEKDTAPANKDNDDDVHLLKKAGPNKSSDPSKQLDPETTPAERILQKLQQPSQYMKSPWCNRIVDGQKQLLKFEIAVGDFIRDFNDNEIRLFQYNEVFLGCNDLKALVEKDTWVETNVHNAYTVLLNTKESYKNASSPKRVFINLMTMVSLYTF